MLNISEIRGVGYKLRRNHIFVFFWPGSGVIKTRIPLTCFYSTRGKRFSFHALRHIHTIHCHILQTQLIQVYILNNIEMPTEKTAQVEII